MKDEDMVSGFLPQPCPRMFMTKLQIHEFRKATPLIESQHPQIIKTACELTGSLMSMEEKAAAIFYFIRDSIKYSLVVSSRESDYTASAILKRGRGFCTQKTLLFCALARHIGLPAGIAFYDIIDYTLSEPFKKMLKTNTLFFHGIPALHINSRWVQCDPTLEKELALQKGFEPVEFNGSEDALMPLNGLDGRKAIKYIHFHGVVPDVTFLNIIQRFRDAYPHRVDIKL